MKMSRYAKILSIVALSLVMISAAVAQGQFEMLALIDQKISSLEKDTKDLVVSGNYFQNVMTLLSFIIKADVKPNDKFDRTLVVASQAIALPIRVEDRPDIIIEEKETIVWFLLGVTLDDVIDPASYSKLRERYSKALVDFVRSLKKDRIVGYQPKPVYLNMPMEAGDNDATRSEKYRRFLVENNANNESNRYQWSLKKQVEYLEPKVIDFLRKHYKESLSDQKELEQFLKLLSE